MDCSMPGFPVLHYLLEFSQIHVCWLRDTIQPFHPLWLPSPPAFNLSQHQGLFKWVSSLHQVAKVLEFQLQHQSFQSIFRVWSPCSPRDSQKSSPALLFQSINFSVLSLFYGPTLTSIHDYWKTITLTICTIVGKVMSLLFNMLSRFVIAFLPGSKHLWISWLQSPSAVILEPKKIKSVTVSTFFPSICHEVMGPDAMIFVFWMLSFKPAFLTLLFHPLPEAL